MVEERVGEDRGYTWFGEERAARRDFEVASSFVLIEGPAHSIYPELRHAVEQVQASRLHLGVSTLIVGTHEYLNYVVCVAGSASPYIGRISADYVEKALAGQDGLLREFGSSLFQRMDQLSVFCDEGITSNESLDNIHVLSELIFP